MDAIQFIKEHGVEKARKVIDGAPGGATHLSDGACHYVNADFKPLPAHIKEQLPKLVDLSDIKRLVEGVDLVESLNGVETAKRYLEENMECSDFKLLKQAIADYDSIYGGEHV